MWNCWRVTVWVDWRRAHQCFRFPETVKAGKCLFCRINDELILSGFEVVPFDVLGAYQGRGSEPLIVLQPIHWSDPPDES